MDTSKTIQIHKAIIPAAGLGTRFLPYTKSIPKEMIPILNKPAMQYIVEEGLNSGVDNFFMITRKDKDAIANHFDTNLELEVLLQEAGKSDLLASLSRIFRTAHFNYLRQCEPRGLGHAIWTARHVVGKEYFSVMLPDDIIVSKQPGLDQLIKVAKQERASVIAVQEVPVEETSSYGIINIKRQITQHLYQVSDLVEKPDQKAAPSNLAIVGRYVLSHKIFASLEEIEADDSGELQLTTAIDHMIRAGEKVFAYKVEGIRHDIGTPVGWVKAIIGCALQDPQFAPHVRSLLADKDAMNMFMYNPTKIIEHNL